MYTEFEKAKSAIRKYEARIALRALAQHSGDCRRASQAILTAIRELPLASLDRYLLFNVGRYALEHWKFALADDANAFDRQLTEAMREMHQREEAQPERKPQKWETAADIRESQPLQSKAPHSKKLNKPHKKAR